MADQVLTDQWRRIIGAVLVVAALALVPSIVGAATEDRVGVGHADCGSWTSPSELSRHRPAIDSEGCAQAIGDATRTIVPRVAAAVLLLVAGVSLLATARVTRWIWPLALVCIVAVIYAESQPGGLATPITGFFYAMVVLVVVLGAARSRSRRRRAAEATES